MRLIRFIFTFSIALLWSAFCALAQDHHELQLELDLLETELDDIFGNESDSLSLMKLIDSLLTSDARYSELQLRLGYSSRVTSAGRDFGVDEQGVIPGISLYHHSGLFADVSGYWNNQLDPNYNLTIVTLGYLGKINRSFSYGLTYDRTFYSKNDSLNTLENSLGASITYSKKIVYSSLDYTYSFGNETAHRLTWSLTGDLSLKGIGPFSRISIFPTFSLLFGSQNITSQYVNIEGQERFDNLTNRQIRRFAFNQGLTRAESLQLITLRNAIQNEMATDEEISLYESYFITSESQETFTLLNYYLTLPIVFYTHRFSFSLSYNYNIPRNLSDDIYYEPNGYLGASIAYRIKYSSSKL